MQSFKDFLSGCVDDPQALIDFLSDENFSVMSLPDEKRNRLEMDIDKALSEIFNQ